MSLVVAIKDGNRFILGADKQTSGWNSKVHTATKIWQTEYENCCIGSVGTARGSQVIQHIKGLLDSAGFGKSELDDTFIHLQLPRTLYETLKAHGVLVDEPDKPFYMPNAFFIAYRDRCWKINQDLSVEEVEEYDAIGSGEEIAQGVIETSLIYNEKNPFKIIGTAVDIAADKTLYVDHELEYATTIGDKFDLPNYLEAVGENPKLVEAIRKECKKLKDNEEFKVTQEFLQSILEEDQPKEQQKEEPKAKETSEETEKTSSKSKRNKKTAE